MKYIILIQKDINGNPIKDANGRMHFLCNINQQTGKKVYMAKSSEGQTQYVDMDWIKKHIKQIDNASMSNQGQVYPVIGETERQRQQDIRNKQELAEKRKHNVENEVTKLSKFINQNGLKQYSQIMDQAKTIVNKYRSLDVYSQSFDKDLEEINKKVSTWEEASINKLEALKEQEKKQHETASKDYINQLKSQGYIEIKYNDSFLGKSNMGKKVIDWLEGCCIEKPDTVTGYKYLACNLAADLLKSKGVMNTRDAVIWHPDIFTKSEDLSFRVFLKENELSYGILIKLPVGLEKFMISEQSKSSITYLFSNTNKENGEVFQSSILGSPVVKHISTQNVQDCEYKVVEIILVKNLLKFGKSSWLFTDYLRACKGEKTAFSQFKELPLGNKIVVGVKPNALKIEQFDCSGQHQTSGFCCGKAGSGKSALLDNLVVQFIALQGDYGNGSVVLMDAKEEWPPLWKACFKSLGVPFYGFDGGAISHQEDIKKLDPKKGVIGFSETITQEVGGMFLMRGLYNVIQSILKQSGCKDVRSFNRANKNINGITRLPRIAIFIDEMNTFAVSATKGTAAAGIMQSVTGAANLTRTAGYMWFLCGQDIPKSIISSEKRGSFGYNIMGTMSSERYTYFNIKENEYIKKYEVENSTADDEFPIMKQGTFYAGPVGKTEVIRSMFLPDDGKEEALRLINSNFEGMWELDRLVRYAISINAFDNFTLGVDCKNNIIYAVLRDIGVISDAEFMSATNRIFGEGDEGGGTESSPGLNNLYTEQSQNQATSNVDNQANMDFDDSDFTLLGDEDIVENTGGGEQSQQETGVQGSQRLPHQNRSQVYQQQTQEQSQYQQSYQQEPQQQQANTVYTGNLVTNSNPFYYEHNNSNSGIILTQKEMTKVIMDEVEKFIGSPDMVTSFNISKTGVLIFNGIEFRPRLSRQFIISAPNVIRNKLVRSELGEFFNLRMIYKFKNLEQLVFFNKRTAQGRARKEMGIGFNRKWNVLFKNRKLKQLQLIQIGDNGDCLIYTRKNPDDNSEEGLLEKFKNNPKLTYIDDGSRINQVLDSAPVRAMAKAVGWTASTALVFGAASVLGPLGLVMGMVYIGSALSSDANADGSRNSNSSSSIRKNHKK